MTIPQDLDFIQDTKDNLDKTSHSEVEAFLKCERSHYYGYGLNGGVRANKESDALVRGNVGHHALATYYQALKDGIPFDDRFRMAIADIFEEIKTYDVYNNDKLTAELAALIGHYLTINRARDEAWEILEVEKIFYVPIGDNFYIKIIVDLIARIPGKGIIVIDHKFVNDFYDAEAMKIAPQLPKYLGAVRSLDMNIAGAAYNQLRYRITNENKEHPELKFSFDYVDINTHRVVQTMGEQIRTARRIQHLKSLSVEEWDARVLRVANTMICRNCSFKSLCIEDLNGDDHTLNLEYNYKRKGSRDPNG